MSTEEEITHVAFADESHWNIGRYRSLSVVTLRKGDVERIEGELRVLLIDSGVGEFKWEKLRQARDRFAARKFCEYAVRAANTGLLRVDVMEWDIEGNRQQFRKRNDVANLQKMYYCLFLNVLRARWPDDSMWQ